MEECSNDTQARCTCEQHSYCKENARLKELFKISVKKFKRRENDRRKLILDLRKLNGKLIKNSC